jgi:hypothetical protein
VRKQQESCTRYGEVGECSLIHLKQISNQDEKRRLNKSKEELACKTLCANISHYVC